MNEGSRGRSRKNCLRHLLSVWGNGLIQGNVRRGIHFVPNHIIIWSVRASFFWFISRYRSPSSPPSCISQCYPPPPPPFPPCGCVSVLFCCCSKQVHLLFHLVSFPFGLDSKLVLGHPIKGGSKLVRAQVLFAVLPVNVFWDATLS